MVIKLQESSDDGSNTISWRIEIWGLASIYFIAIPCCSNKPLAHCKKMMVQLEA